MAHLLRKVIVKSCTEVIQVKYERQCKCGTPILLGEEVYTYPDTGEMVCKKCGDVLFMHQPEEVDEWKER